MGMRKFIFPAFCLLMVSCAGVTRQWDDCYVCGERYSRDAKYCPDMVLVTFKDDVSPETRIAVLRKYAGEIVSSNHDVLPIDDRLPPATIHYPFYMVRKLKHRLDVEKTVDFMMRELSVKSAQPNFIYH